MFGFVGKSLRTIKHFVWQWSISVWFCNVKTNDLACQHNHVACWYNILCMYREQKYITMLLYIWEEASFNKCESIEKWGRSNNNLCCGKITAQRGFILTYILLNSNTDYSHFSFLNKLSCWRNVKMVFDKFLHPQGIWNHTINGGKSIHWCCDISCHHWSRRCSFCIFFHMSVILDFNQAHTHARTLVNFIIYQKQIRNFQSIFFRKTQKNRTKQKICN